jgi:hypothetical protein
MSYNVFIFFNYKPYVMKQIKHSDPREIIEGSNAKFFQIFLQTETGSLYSWANSGFQNVIDGHNDAHLFQRHQVVKAYYDALIDAREESSPPLFAGTASLDILPLLLPPFVGGSNASNSKQNDR